MKETLQHTIKAFIRKGEKYYAEENGCFSNHYWLGMFGSCTHWENNTAS